MRTILRLLAVIALLISLSWAIFDFGFEPVLTSVISLSALISTFFFHSNVESEDSALQKTEGPKVTYQDNATHNGDNHF